MDEGLLYDTVVNGLLIEVYDSNPEENFWENRTVYVYDCLSDLTDKERDIIVNYLYSEGFIDDRRTRCEVIRGEDYL
ncbi:hypothetical protein CL634_10260 [bacterium]|nr:hypothetical protein [bacterium]|tara:strand:+ start:116 stop:346 length:231 start_codon:yes stop_codon:yes gene_type:complete